MLPQLLPSVASAGSPWRGRLLPSVYPNVTVVDWEAESANVAGELSRSDGGIHLSTSHAKQFYANLIFFAIGRADLAK